MSRLVKLAVVVSMVLTAAPRARAQEAPAPPPPPPREIDPNPDLPPGGDEGAGAGDTTVSGEGATIGGGTGQVPDEGAAPAEPQGIIYDTDELGREPDEEGGLQFTGPTPELHVVKKGDTLWDICFYYFNNPWEWPRIWSYNATITNPHWIYPGDLVRLMAPGAVPETAAPQAARSPTAQTVPPPEPPPPPSYVEMRQLAFVDADKLRFAGRIKGSPEEKVLLGPGDEVYLEYPEDNPPQVRKRYAVYSETKPVIHPVTGAKVGAYVMLKGEVEVTEVKKGKKARGVLTYTTDIIERGDRVGPTKTQFKQVTPVPAEKDIAGVIIAMFGTDQIIGANQVVFIDRGADAGVKPGYRFLVIRRGDAYQPQRGPRAAVERNDKHYPDDVVGQIVIVDVGPRTSVGIVTASAQEIEIGDRVLVREGQ